MFGCLGGGYSTRSAQYASDDAQADLRAYLDRNADIMIFDRGKNLNTYWENYREATLSELVRRASAQKRRIRDALANEGKLCATCGMVRHGGPLPSPNPTPQNGRG